MLRNERFHERGGDGDGAAGVNGLGARRAEATRGQQGARILIVDDEPSLTLTLKYLLQDRHEVTTACSGEEALTLLRSGVPYDAILCDLMMPGTNGIDVFTTLARERPGDERRIIFMTGGAFTPRCVSFLEANENPRLEKPFTLREVDAALQRLGPAEAKASH